MEVNLLTPFLTTPKSTEEVLELKKESRMFFLKETITDITNEKIAFLKKLHQHALPEYKTDPLSAIYFFQAGNAIFELDVLITDEISIKPYFHYNTTTIKKDIYKAADLDYLLHSVLTIHKLQ